MLPSLSLAAVLVTGGGLPPKALKPPKYVAQDITSYSSAQWEAMTNFHYSNGAVPWVPDGAPSGFVPTAWNQGLAVGYVPTISNPYVQDEGVFISGGVASNPLAPFGSYYYQYFNGSVEEIGYVGFFIPEDVDWGGIVVGVSTIAGSGTDPFAYGTCGFGDGVASGYPVDLTKGYARAEMDAVNAGGATAGAAGTTTKQQAFRRDEYGNVTLLHVGGDSRAYLIDAASEVAGTTVVLKHKVPNMRAIGSHSGAGTVKLALAKGDRDDSNQPFGMNGLGWIAGQEWNSTASQPEYRAVLWLPTPKAWTAWDLTAQLLTPGIRLDRAIALDEAGDAIAYGVPTSGSGGERVYLLTAQPS